MTDDSPTTTSVDTTAIPGEIADLPPSAVAVWLLLTHEIEPASQQELADQGRLAVRTVRYALKRLEESDLVESQIVAGDARRRSYRRCVASDRSRP